LTDVALLVAGGLVGGIVNTLAGGGSLLTVPLLVLCGLPGTIANGTNRVGVLCQNLVAGWRFAAAGVPGRGAALAVLAPVCLGSLVGAYTISLVGDRTFEILFGLLMIALAVPVLLLAPRAAAEPLRRRWSPATLFLVFLAIGLYGGAFQAGVGIPLVAALSYTGHDLLRANSVKVVLNGALALIAVPVFVIRQQVAWGPALALAAGYAAGGVVGVHLAVVGGERLLRPVLVAAALALAGRMLGLY
jgi:uncharacterized membrane protein YfcA